VKNPYLSNSTTPYYYAPDENEYAPDKAFNPKFDISKPLVDVIQGDGFTDYQVLVNYIDHSSGPTPTASNECQIALGNPKDTTGVTPKDIPETTLRIPPAPPDDVKSFYACVDTSKNIARVTIRGNSLRRLQPNDTDYKAEKAAYFPTASVQVQGLGGLGK
jgi:hypothetical protein